MPLVNLCFFFHFLIFNFK